MDNQKTGYIVGLGEALWDCLPGGKKLGGAPANFAFHAGQFGYNSVAVSAVGKDELGDETLRAFDEKRLSYVMPRVDYPTGTVQVTLDAEGVPSYDIRQGVAWDNIPFTSDVERVARNCIAVCWGSLAQRNNVSRLTINRFLDTTPEDCMKIFDINLRQSFYTLDVLEESFRRCDMLKINDEELVIVGHLLGRERVETEPFCKELLEKYNLKMLVLTCGTNGSYVFTPAGTSFQATPHVEVADTVGAGDSFTGSFCASILSGKTVKEAHRIAVAVSAYVCTQAGAMPLVPDNLKR